MKVFTLLLTLLVLPQILLADVEHKLFRKVAVFPIFDANYSTAEDAWWQMRELLTKDKKLFVAAKRFMINRGVFQPRKALKPADAIILGRLLDAEALVVTYVEDRNLKMKVYEGENGFLLWEAESQFHPAIPMSDQLIKLSTKMISDFLESIPYQGYTEKNESAEKVLYEKGGKKFTDVFSGGRSPVQKGDLVQWLSLKGNPSPVLFGQLKEKVIAEGVVAEVNGDHLVVEVKTATDLDDIAENTLVRFPSELSKLRDLYSKESTANNWNGDYFKNELKPVAEFQKDHQPAATGIAFFINVVAFVLLAF